MIEEEDGSVTEEDEETEPQVTSNNPEERKLARKLRIERRVEALLKQQRDERESMVEEEQEKNPIEKQVEKSLEFLEKLLLDGEEHLTNVRIANESRETDRRERGGIASEKLMTELEEEATKAQEMFNEIANKWSKILKYNDPLHISEDMQFQKERCDDLIKQKDEIIATLRAKIALAEIDFGIDQRKQIGDINSLSKRIENQVIIMRKAYRQEMLMIEEVMMAERQLLIEATNKKWEDLSKKRDTEEKQNFDKRTEDYWNFVKDIENLNRDFNELYRQTNIKLENDCDELQRELERIKTEALFNSEKLDYNYQILKKREDENMIIRSQQKRRINKLQDIINSLRKKINGYQRDTGLQIEKLRAEITKIQNNILNIEDKADHMANVNNFKFQKVWDMNNERANKLFDKILEIDKILYEQQLGLNWQRPIQNPPNKMNMESYKAARVLLQNERKDENTSVALVEVSFNQTYEDFEEGSSNRRVVKKILEHICDKTGFLIEEQLNDIIKPYVEDEKTLIRVDNVFAALNVTQKDDINVLYSHFLPYMFCPICNAQSERFGLESLLKVHEMSHVSLKDMAKRRSTVTDYISIPGINIEADGTVIDFGPLSITIFDDNLEGECKGPGLAVESKEVESEDSSVESIIRERAACKKEHPLVINSVYVLKGLKEFLSDYHTAKASMPTMSTRLSYERKTISRLITTEDIETFWKVYTQLFPKYKEELWDSLLEGLRRYHELLKGRKAVSEQVVTLRRQNNDLRKLFTNYLRENPLPYD